VLANRDNILSIQSSQFQRVETVVTDMETDMDMVTDIDMITDMDLEEDIRTWTRT
jgi:hypothetical protein